ncbi:hypothetical protein DsansV1_C01g0010531 [Dioscorea sansibarensis]
MLERITIDFAGACEKETGAHTLSESEHVQSSNHVRYDRLDGIELVMNRRSRASEVIDLIDLEKQWLDNVMADQLEVRVSEVMHNVLLPPREEVINNDDAITSRHQPIHEMATHKPRPTGNHDPKPLTLQPERDLCPDGKPPFRVRCDGARDDGEGRDGCSGGGGGGGGGGGEGEEEGSDGHADEDEEKALLTEEVA